MLSPDRASDFRSAFHSSVSQSSVPHSSDASAEAAKQRGASNSQKGDRNADHTSDYNDDAVQTVAAAAEPEPVQPKPYVSGAIDLFSGFAAEGSDTETDAPAPAGEDSDTSQDTTMTAVPVSGRSGILDRGLFSLNLFNGGSTVAIGGVRPHSSAATANDGNLTGTAELSGNPALLSPMLSEGAQPGNEPAPAAAGKDSGVAIDEAGSANKILDPGDLRIDVSSNASSSSAPVAFEAKLSQFTSANPQEGTLSSNTAPSPKAPANAPAEAASVPEAVEPAPKVEAPLAAIAVSAGSTASSAHATSSPSTAATDAPNQSSPVERLQPLMEAPAPLASSNHAITVNVAGETPDMGIALRFVERGGDIHLTVRTPNAEVAQELRGGLGDLAGRFEHAGLRAEISSPAAAQNSSSNSSFSNHSSPDSPADEGRSGGRGSGRNPGDSRNSSQDQQQEPQPSNRTGWIQAIQNISTSGLEHKS